MAKSKQPKIVTAADYQKKYVARSAPKPKQKGKIVINEELSQQHQLMKWFKREYPNALAFADLAGSAGRLSIEQRMLHSQRTKRGYPDLIFHEVFKDIHSGLAIEFKKLGIDVPKMCEKDKHFQEQLEYLHSLRSRGWCAVFCVGVHAAQQVINAYMDGNDNYKEIINKYAYPKM